MTTGFEENLKVAEIVREKVIDEIEELRPGFKAERGRSVAINQPYSGLIWVLAIDLQVQDSDRPSARVEIRADQSIVTVARLIPDDAGDLVERDTRLFRIESRVGGEPQLFANERMVEYREIANLALAFAYSDILSLLARGTI